MDVKLKEKERIDELQRNGYRIIQDPDRFCFGMDAVLLSGFASAKEGDKVLDLGTGTGIIPILMEAKTKASHLVKYFLPFGCKSCRNMLIYRELQTQKKERQNRASVFHASHDFVPPYRNF